MKDDEPEDVDRVVDVEDVLAIEPLGTKGDEVGRDPSLDDELGGFDHGDHPVVGTCELCGREIHEDITGHVCEDGFRHHRNGEQIAPVDEPGLICDGGEDVDEPGLIYVGEGAPEDVREALEPIEHRRGSWAEVAVRLPTAELERLLLEIEETDHDTVADFIRTLFWVRLTMQDHKRTQKTQVDVPVSEDAWRRVSLQATAWYQQGKDPEDAFHDAMTEMVPVAYNYIPKGSHPSVEPYTYRDLPIEADDDEDGEADDDLVTDGGGAEHDEFEGVLEAVDDGLGLVPADEIEGELELRRALWDARSELDMVGETRVEVSAEAVEWAEAFSKVTGDDPGHILFENTYLGIVTYTVDGEAVHRKE